MSEATNKKKKILLVDDDPDITTTFQLSLEDTGFFEVETYNDSTEALSNFQANSYDLVLLDIKMPKMSGFELYKK
jgi:DNA-binding response OmpR family regulator